MKPVSRFDRLALSVSAILLVATAVEVGWPHALVLHDGALAESEPATAHGASATFAYPARGVLEGMTQRPLFTTDRRPYQPPQSETQLGPTSPPPPTIQAELVGIARAADSRLILLRLGGASTVHRLRLGGQIEGWTVTSIEAATATLTSNGHERQLSLVSNVQR